MFLFSLFYTGWMRRDTITVFLPTITIGHASIERPHKKIRVHAILLLKVENEKEEDDDDEEVERIAAFDFDFLCYVYNSL